MRQSAAGRRGGRLRLLARFDEKFVLEGTGAVRRALSIRFPGSSLGSHLDPQSAAKRWLSSRKDRSFRVWSGSNRVEHGVRSVEYGRAGNQEPDGFVTSGKTWTAVTQMQIILHSQILDCIGITIANCILHTCSCLTPDPLHWGVPCYVPPYGVRPWRPQPVIFEISWPDFQNLNVIRLPCLSDFWIRY